MLSARKYLFIAGLLLALVVVSRPASAIPALARKYGQACSTCHSPGFPRLNDFGKSIKEQGYYQEGGKEIALGDWLRMSELPPFAVLVKAYPLSHNKSSGVVFDTPHEVEVFWADSLGPSFSVFAEVEFEAGEAGAGSTYLDWHSQDRKWSLRAGNFAPSDWLAKELGTGHFRLTRARYQFEEVRQDTSQRIGRDTPGFMLYGRPAKNWWFDLAVTDGDTANKQKDFWGHTSFALSNGILISPFFYAGKFGPSPAQDFTQAGLGVFVPLKNLTLSGAFSSASFDTASGDSRDYTSGFLGVNYPFNDRAYIEGRWEFLNRDAFGSTPSDDRTFYNIQIGYLILENVRTGLEYNIDNQNSDNNQFTFLVLAVV